MVMDFGEAVSEFQEFYDTIDNLNINQNTCLELDVEELDIFNPELFDYIKNNAVSGIDAAQEALANYSSTDQDIEIKLVNFYDEDIILPKNIRSDLVNELVIAEGLLVNVEENSPEIKSAIFECTACGDCYEKEKDSSDLESPYKCDCGGKTFQPVEKMITDVQYFDLKGKKKVKCFKQGSIVGLPDEISEKEARVVGIPIFEDNEIKLEVINVIFDYKTTISPESLADASFLTEFIKESFDLEDIDSFFDSLDPDRFEELLASIFSKAGWRTQTTTRSNDRGIDVIARKRFPIRRKYLIQAKCNSQGNNLSADDVRNYHALRDQENNVDQVILATTSDFSNQAKIIGEKLDIKLLNRRDLKMIINNLKKFEEKGMLEIDNIEGRRNGETEVSGEFDIDMIETQDTNPRTVKINFLKEKIDELAGDKDSASIEKLKQEAPKVDLTERTDEGINEELSEDEVEEIMEKLKREGELFEPVEGRIQKI